jgi:hypothetical protein
MREGRNVQHEKLKSGRGLRALPKPAAVWNRCDLALVFWECVQSFAALAKISSASSFSAFISAFEKDEEEEDEKISAAFGSGCAGLEWMRPS